MGIRAGTIREYGGRMSKKGGGKWGRGGYVRQVKCRLGGYYGRLAAWSSRWPKPLWSGPGGSGHCCGSKSTAWPAFQAKRVKIFTFRPTSSHIGNQLSSSYPPRIVSASGVQTMSQVGKIQDFVFEFTVRANLLRDDCLT